MSLFDRTTLPVLITCVSAERSS